MKTLFRASFAKDLQRIRDLSVVRHIREAVERVEQARSIGEVPHLKKLHGGTRAYRVRVGDYRLGIIVEDDSVTFVRVLHRKDIYRYFP